jgi:hypothetical protein
MVLSPAEKMYLLNRLPALELSYEPKLHKKVYAPIYYIIPKGPKALIWYTYWNDRNVCFLIKINERGNYSDVQPMTSVFSDTLALGTIIYGTYFLHYNRHYFTCEQLYYYKGLAVAKKTYNERLNLLTDMFVSHVEQLIYTPDSLVVGLPVMTETYEEALAEMDKVPYKTYGVAAVAHTTSPNAFASTPNAFANAPSPNAFAPTPTAYAPTPNAYAPTPTPNAFAPTPNAFAPTPNAFAKAIFGVKADLAADNYHLFTAENTFYETAMVPTYKCSVMLNALFRNIKENANLDLLEESDDEAEFENTQIDKFVDLEKMVMMECVYSKRFKKWQPVKPILTLKPKIISLKELEHFYKK